MNGAEATVVHLCVRCLLGRLEAAIWLSVRMGAIHQSDSVEQRDAESVIIAELSRKEGVTLVSGGTITLSNGAKVKVDARSEDGRIFVEAYSRQGALKGSQPHKVARDVLKLALIRSDPAYQGARSIVVFASEAARNSVTKWIESAASAFGVEFAVVEIDEQTRARVLAAQDRQGMVNKPIQGA